MAVVRMDIRVCILLRHLAAVSLAEATGIAIMVVDTVDTLHRATEAAWEWVTRHMELLE